MAFDREPDRRRLHPVGAAETPGFPGERFLPDVDASRTYDRLYRDVYLALYGRLRPLYERIRRITHYPA